MDSVRSGMLCSLSLRTACALTSVPSLQADTNIRLDISVLGAPPDETGAGPHPYTETTSNIQCFIMMASSAPLSPFPYAATGFPAYSKPSQ